MAIKRDEEMLETCLLASPGAFWSLKEDDEEI